MDYVTRNCNRCQQPYVAEQRYLNRGQGIYCSQSCSSANRARPKEPNAACAVCESLLRRRPSKTDMHFCSKLCRSKAHLAGLIQSGPPPTAKTRKRSVSCKCGRANHSISFVECQLCRKEAQHSQIIAAWLDGDNSVTLSLHCTKPFVKLYLIETRGDACERCGFDEKAPDGRSIIQMDHINGQCFDNRLENLRLLCPNCHAMTDNYGSLNRNSQRAHRRKSGALPD